MGKDGFLTPKAIANRMKAKGLGKLKWWCQLCNKQCRDDNGYKCHLMSESHNRQVLLFTENPGMYVHSYSREFESTFLNILRVQYGTKRVAANTVYQQHIADKSHVHMNATTWGTLSGFVQYLGRTGKAIVEETDKGWFLTYIERDPEAVARQEAAARQDRAAKTEEERQRQELELQVAKAFEAAGPAEDAEFKEFQKADDEEKVVLTLKPTAAASAIAKKAEPIVKKPAIAAALEEEFEEPAEVASTPLSSISFSSDGTRRAFSGPSDGPAAKKPRLSALEEIRMNEERHKQRLAEAEAKQRVDYWLAQGIAVKVMNKQLADGKYYKQKGVVQKVIDRYVGEIKMDESGDVLRLDQEHCETVIPAIGRPVLILNGSHRGEEASLERLNVDAFNATLKLSKNGRILDAVPYEDFSKLA